MGQLGRIADEDNGAIRAERPLKPKPKLLLTIAVSATFTVIAVLHFRYNAFARAALPSVCSATSTGDLGMDLLTLAGFHRLPDGIPIPFTHESDAQGHQAATVVYRDRAYGVTMRKDGLGVCLNFNPPLPLERSKRTIKADVESVQGVVYDFFFVRWPYAFGLGLIVVWLGLLAKRNRRLAMETGEEFAPTALLDVCPDLAHELEALLAAQGESDLAAQIAGLKIVDRCRCGDDFCSTFYTLPKPDGAYGPYHRNVELEPETGTLVVDVNDDQIAAIEVLYRDEIREKIHALLP